MNESLRLKLGDWFWRNVLQPYLFGKEAEDAHLFTLRTLKRMQQLNLLWLLKLLYRPRQYLKPVKALGVCWRNPVGLAAGFDKQGEVIPAFEALGFGSVEIGTVTPRPQPGNDPPRLFRNLSRLAVLNRYGFNSDGAAEVANHLMAPGTGTISARFKLPIGVSIGKNKGTADADAVKDYLAALESVFWALRPGTDWVKINISSPNTPQLRDIFCRLDEFLGEFAAGAASIATEHDVPLPPLVLKVPPDDIGQAQLERVVELCARYGFSGIEGTNTTTDRIIKARCGWANEAGGVSGEPLRELATAKLAAMKEVAARKKIDLIGVGGISRGWHALEKRDAGAKAVQVHTGLVFRGPALPSEILHCW